MRKGLVVTLGVMALFLAVSQSFALAPVISCIPDIIVSDAEDNTQTSDRNFFIFSNALNLDEVVRDDDTTKSLLKWCFVESSNVGSIAINGIGGYTGTNFRDPGAFNIRAVRPNIAVRNIEWSPLAGSLPFPTPTQASTETMIQLYVSDSTRTDSQTVVITTVNTTNSLSINRDRLVMQSLKSYTFEAGQEGWEWIPSGPPIIEAGHQLAAGALQMTGMATADPNSIVYGSWESTKNPTTGLQATWGCILRARFAMRSSVSDLTCPGFRFRALWTHVAQSGGNWVTDFMNPDYSDDYEMTFSTIDTPFTAVPGRPPGSGKTIDMLYWPQQIDTLMTTDAVVMISADLVDMDTFNQDAGILYVDRVDVDGVDRPDGSAGTTVTALTFNSFTNWTKQIVSVGTGSSTAGLTLNCGASSIDINVAAGNKMFEASAASPGTALESGRYYRVIFTATSTQASGNIGPTIRASFVSSKYVFSANKTLKGGGTWSQLGPTPQELEVWMQAPSPLPPSTTQTEPMILRFESYLLDNPAPPFMKTVAGVVHCTKVVTHSFPASP